MPALLPAQFDLSESNNKKCRAHPLLISMNACTLRVPNTMRITGHYIGI